MEREADSPLSTEVLAENLDSWSQHYGLYSPMSQKCQDARFLSKDYSYSWCLFVQTGSCYVAQAWNSPSSYLSLWSAGITDVCHHAQLSLLVCLQ
jgi:hypothetical protein